MLNQYVAAFENADAAALERLLCRDATLELPPSPVWYAGDDAIANALASLGSPGDWRMLPAAANGQPAAATYLRAGDGAYQAYGIVVLTTTTSTGIAGITVFAIRACSPGSVSRRPIPAPLRHRPPGHERKPWPESRTPPTPPMSSALSRSGTPST